MTIIERKCLYIRYAARLKPCMVPLLIHASEIRLDHLGQLADAALFVARALTYQHIWAGKSGVL